MGSQSTGMMGCLSCHRERRNGYWGWHSVQMLCAVAEMPSLVEYVGGGMHKWQQGEGICSQAAFSALEHRLKGVGIFHDGGERGLMTWIEKEVTMPKMRKKKGKHVSALLAGVLNAYASITWGETESTCSPGRPLTPGNGSGEGSPEFAFNKD